MDLGEVNVKRLYIQVAERLASLIQAGEVKPGERLPSERDLAARFGVSRPTIREAMITLEVMGVVEVRLGSGIYVRETGSKRLVLPDDSPGPFEILEARLRVESEVCSLAAARITDDEIKQLKSILKAMDDPELDAAEVEQFDQQFHTLIATASRNSALVSVVKWLWQLRNDSEISALFHEHARETGSRPLIEEHKRILSALMQRDAVAAEDAMRKHLQRTIELLTELNLAAG